MEEWINGPSTYCSLHNNGKCGACICRNDFDVKEKYYCDCQNLAPKRDCREFINHGVRVSDVTMSGNRHTQVYCDQTTDGGIQRWNDGSKNFYRNWNEYKAGFGKLHKEFWFGNDNIH